MRNNNKELQRCQGEQSPRLHGEETTTKNYNNLTQILSIGGHPRGPARETTTKNYNIDPKPGGNVYVMVDEQGETTTKNYNSATVTVSINSSQVASETTTKNYNYDSNQCSHRYH